MDKWMLAGMMCLLAMNLNTVLQKPSAVETDDFALLAKVYQEEGYPFEVVVLSAWFALEQANEAEQYLTEHWQLSPLENDKRLTWQDGTTLQICRKKGTVITMELISDNLTLANQQYKLWQEFSNRYAGGKPVGITFCSSYEESLHKNTRQHLAKEIAEKLATDLIIDLEQEDHESYTFYSAELSQSLEINGVRLNGNLAFVERNGRTSMYLGSPVIYQQY